MFYYRLYFMSAQNGHINRFADYEAPDDEAAMALAGEHEGASLLELWCGHRKVGRIEPADAQSKLVERWRLAREKRMESGSATSQ